MVTSHSVMKLMKFVVVDGNTVDITGFVSNADIGRSFLN